VIEFDIVAKGAVSLEDRTHAAERLASLDKCVPVPGERVMRDDLGACCPDMD